jgi:8-oxo-dGTP pyrophosphatase MutT (NUDIX family)
MKWEPLGERVLLDGYFKVVDARFRLPDGTEISRWLLRQRRPALVLCCNERGDVLLTRQYRAPFDEVEWEIPGGDVEPGEDVVAAAAREFEEETGYKPEQVEHVLTSRASPGESDAEWYICIARGTVPGQIQLAPDEQITHAWVPLEQALAMAQQKVIRHAGALIALLYASATGGIRP